MAKNLPLLIFIGLLTLFFTSCEKVPGHLTGVTPTGGTTTGGGTNTKGGSYLTFKVDGVSKTSAFNVATYYLTSGNSIQISGQIGQIGGPEGVSIMIPNPRLGIFDVTVGNTVFIYTVTTSNYYTGTTTGIVTITAFTNSTITGTFSFTGEQFSGTGTKLITNGTFSMPYTKM